MSSLASLLVLASVAVADEPDLHEDVVASAPPVVAPAEDASRWRRLEVAGKATTGVGLGIVGVAGVLGAVALTWEDSGGFVLLTAGFSVATVGIGAVAVGAPMWAVGHRRRVRGLVTFLPREGGGGVAVVGGF